MSWGFRCFSCLGIAVYLSVLGVGNFLSSILISVTEKLSCKNKGSCWFVDNPSNCVDAHTESNYAFMTHPSCDVDDLNSIYSSLQLCIELAINDYL